MIPKYISNVGILVRTKLLAVVVVWTWSVIAILPWSFLFVEVLLLRTRDRNSGRSLRKYTFRQLLLVESCWNWHRMPACRSSRKSIVRSSSRSWVYSKFSGLISYLERGLHGWHHGVGKNVSESTSAERDFALLIKRAFSVINYLVGVIPLDWAYAFDLRAVIIYFIFR